MSTENRSSNTEQMVSVPLVERLTCLMQDLTFMKDRNTIREAIALFAQLAPFPGYPTVPEDRKLANAQHQGEPAEWRYRFDESKGAMVADDAGDWAYVGQSQFNTNGDIGEATAAIKTLQGVGYTYHGAELWKPPLGKAPDFDLIDTLRAQLAERDTLLRDIYAQNELSIRDDERIEAALSASAEPAPTSDSFSAEQMAIQGADGYRNGIKAAAELAADYPELAQAIRALPLPQ